jgi:hypothetical protein
MSDECYKAREFLASYDYSLLSCGGGGGAVGDNGVTVHFNGTNNCWVNDKN